MAETARAQEVVRRLLKAEEEASARLAEAEERSRRRLEAARDASARRRSEALEQAERERRDALQAARDEAEAHNAALLDRERQRWQRYGDAAQARLPAATARLVAWVCADALQETP